MRAIKWSSSSPRYLKKNKFVKYIQRKKGQLQLPEPEVQMTHSVNPLNSSTFVTCFQGQKEEHVKGLTQWRSEIVIILLFPNTIVALNHSFTCFMQFEVCTGLFPWTTGLQRSVPSGRGICLQHTPRVHLYSKSRGDSDANVYGIMKIGALRQGNMFRTRTPSESVAHPEVTAVNANVTPCHGWIFWQFEWHRERERGVRDQ